MIVLSLWRAGKHLGKEPEDWQEPHSPTVKTEIIVSHSPRRVKAGPRRRAAQERLWSGLTHEEVRAAEELELAWRAMLGGLTAVAQRYERLDRGIDHAAEIHVDIRNAYNLWRQRLGPLERAACMCLLFDDIDQNTIALAYGKATAWPRANLGHCLAVWTEIRGWT